MALLPADPSARRRRLTAFVVPAGEAPAARDLDAHLRRSLPAAYVPAAYAVVAALPRTPGGKIDRRALRELESLVPLRPTPAAPTAPAAGWEAPRTPVQELLAGLWSAVLGVPRIELHDDFLALGGHSLTATLLLSRIREAFRVELPLGDLFAAPTPRPRRRSEIEAALATPTALPAPAAPLAARPRLGGARRSPSPSGGCGSSTASTPACPPTGHPARPRAPARPARSGGGRRRA